MVPPPTTLNFQMYARFMLLQHAVITQHKHKHKSSTNTVCRYCVAGQTRLARPIRIPISNCDF